MAKKGDNKKSSSKKGVSSKKDSKKVPSVNLGDMSSKKRFNFTLRNFLISGVLALAFFAIYQYVEKIIYQNTFYYLFMVFFFIALAFLIIFLAVVFARKRKKKKSKS